MHNQVNAFVLLCGIYVDFHSCSTVDLVLTSEKAFTKEKITKYLSVKNFSHLSDHSPVLLCFILSEVLNSEMGHKI